jgi:predicted dehydrogenase
MNSDKPGIGIIGSGKMGRVNLRLLLEAHGDRLALRGICDPLDSSRQAAAELVDYDVPVYDDPDALCRADDIDWVLIASWNCYHRHQAEAAFRAGKHVFLQKPIATNLEDALAIKDAWEESSSTCIVGFTLRFSPFYRKIKEVLTSGRIGYIVSMEFNETLDFNHGGFIHGDWRRLTKYAGTHLLEKCCHDIDLVNWMTESLPRRVASFGGLDFFLASNRHIQDDLGLSPDNHPRGGGVRAFESWAIPGTTRAEAQNPFLTEKDIVDNQVAILEYANGIRATFHTNCCSAFAERRMVILGSRGAIRADLCAGKVEVRQVGWETEAETVLDVQAGGHGGGDEVIAKEMGECIFDGARPAADLNDGILSAIASFAIDEAMETGQVVDVLPYWQAANISPNRNRPTWEQAPA